jgi:alkanesulfonate monooxygenase SsuD/methylene tetrahydromethanopterin reductase-like flavin-dependent oxidoreductase (luciferase family)
MSTRRLRQGWRLFQDLAERHHGRPLRRGENRMLVINVTIGDSAEHAKSIARNGHDEFWRFLAPYGRQVNYLDAAGKSWPNTRYPTLEESMEQGAWVVGSGREVAETLCGLQEELGIEYLTIFPQLPGMDRAVVLDQLERFTTDVAPALRERAPAIDRAGPSRIEVADPALSAIEGHQATTRDAAAVTRS